MHLFYTIYVTSGRQYSPPNVEFAHGRVPLKNTWTGCDILVFGSWYPISETLPFHHSIISIWCGLIIAKCILNTYNIMYLHCVLHSKLRDRHFLAFSAIFFGRRLSRGTIQLITEQQMSTTIQYNTMQNAQCMLGYQWRSSVKENKLRYDFRCKMEYLSDDRSH